MNTNQQMKKCEICQSEISKYKCPTCLIRYCSFGCYKSHKEKDCKPLNISKISEKAADTLHDNKNSVLEDGEIADNHEEEFEQSEDKVSQEKLQTLGQSKEMLALLENPHLRTIMKSLYNSDSPREEMEVAMKEPIFEEFADECLKLVDQDKT